jgi:hypothetical protein
MLQKFMNTISNDHLVFYFTEFLSEKLCHQERHEVSSIV